MKSPLKRIIASYDDKGVYVYQAFTPSIVQSALEHGTFDKGFSLDRMTWIKPSFGWMLYRSGYASKHGQEAILKIKLLHSGFLDILRQSVETSFQPFFESETAWSSALAKSDVRHQWDPDRAVSGQRLDRRAIQIGIRGKTVQRYVHDWIIGLEDVTDLARDIQKAIKLRNTLPEVPHEDEYKVDHELSPRLGIPL